MNNPFLHIKKILILYQVDLPDSFLEATSVLVITENKQELNDWLDFEKANSELDDKYRLGYVAFSRAREMLSICCLENIDIQLTDKLKNMNVTIYQ
jgi:DNA helicase II / ATP-dependent DNA helicase PcrA